MRDVTEETAQTMRRISAAIGEFVRNPDLDTISAGFGFDIGVAAACLHPEWAQSMFLALHPTESAREGARAALPHLIDRLSMAVEQEEEEQQT